MKLTQKRNGKNVIPLLMAVCGINLPYWRIDKADDLHSYLSGDAADKLTAYEDAEEQGLLVRLPCKVGDTIYEIDLPEYGVIVCKVFYVDCYCGPFAHAPGGKIVSATSVGIEVVEGHGKGSSYAFEKDDFGKTVFLTREEAEAALKGEMEDA